MPNLLKIQLIISCLVLSSIIKANNIANISNDNIDIYNYEYYTTDDGLSSNNVTALHIDNNGMLWIGTDDGINSFDGYKFNNHTSDIFIMSKSCGKNICDIKGDENNNILIATSDKGLSQYQINGRKFLINDFADSLNIRNVNFNNVYGICLLNNKQYFKFEDFVLEHDCQSNHRYLIKMPENDYAEGLSMHKSKMISLPDYSNIVIGIHKSSLVILDTEKRIVKEVKFPKTMSIFDMCVIDSESVYLATSNGLLVFNVKTKKLSYSILKGHIVQSIAKSKSNDYWVAYDNTEILKWIPSKNKIRQIRLSRQLLNSQSFVNSLLEDENGMLWVASSNAGLLKFDTKPPKIISYDVKADLLPNYKTLDIHALSKNDIWAVCGTEGVQHINITTGVATTLRLPQYNYRSVLVRKNGEILLGTTQGLLLYNQETKRYEEIPLVDNQYKNITVNELCEDCLGNIWIATQCGLYKYNGAVLKKIDLSVKDDNILSAFEDKEGNIWVATESGVKMKKANQDDFADIKGNSETSNIMFVPQCFDDNGREILIGTTGGLIIYNKSNENINQASFNDIFGNTKIYSVVSDSTGIIWLSTNKGIGYVDTNLNITHIFNRLDGLNHIGSGCRKFTVAQDNTIYFGNVTHINSIQPNKIQFNTTPPQTFINEIRYGQSENANIIKMTNDSCYETKFLVKASLIIKVASSDFSIPSRNQFMYQINDEDWQQLAEGSNVIVLSGLMPDTYEIKIRSSNSDKTWTDSPCVVYVKINTPMWGSKPAIVFYIIMVLTIVWMLLNLRFRNLRKRMKQIENEARAKKVVEAQRNRLAKIHKDQTDSINYAKRIQDLIMSKDVLVKNNFNKLFVLYKPKDIVSGDFYSFYNRDKKTFIISADCTGHGVPGAFLSILGIDHLFNIIMRQKIDDAGTILTKLHNELHETVFKENSSSSEFNDGMDMTICVVHHDEKKITFAGAMNDVYCIRNNEIMTIHGNRHSIGTSLSIKDENQSVLYDSQVIECQPGDIFYMFSDGYIDQFGGPEQKKFKHRRFKHLLMNIHKLPARDQRIILNQKHDEWKGVNEQTDDISVIGFEPWA